MKVGMIGFQASGKSSLYRAAAKGQAKGSVTAVPVPDARFDQIVEQVKPKKITPATVILHDDLDAVQGSGRMFSQKLLDDARKMDIFLHVVRAYDSPMAPYYAEVDPVRDQRRVDEEFLLSDLQIMESRLEKLAKSMNVKKPGHPEYVEHAVLERLRDPLMEGTPLRAMDLSEDELLVLRNYQFLSLKYMVVAFNVGEDEAAQPSDAVRGEIDRLLQMGTQAFAACATLEEEISQLDPADQPDFLASLGLTEPASAKVIRAIYEQLGLITFFTAGENETRAWPLRRGSNALKAAGTIHTDIAKGFIRAEIVHYEDYLAAGSLDAAYSGGKMHLEGKEYVIRDGDMLHIRNKS